MKLSLRFPYFKFVVFFIVFFSVLIDLATGFLIYLGADPFIGPLYRAMIILFSILISVRRFDRLPYLYYLLLLFLWLLLFVSWFIFLDDTSFVGELNFFFRVSYFYSLYNIFSFFSKRYDLTDTIYRNLYSYALIASIMIIFSFLTGFGLETYGSYAFGSSSFFNAANDIGISLFVIYTLFLFNNKIGSYDKPILLLLILFLALILLGTTVGMFGVFISTSVFLFFYAISNATTRLKRIFIFGSMSLLIVAASFFLFFMISSNPYFQRKYDKFLEEGPRATLTNSAYSYICDRGVFRNVLGEGHENFGLHYSSTLIGNKRESKEGAYVENDLYDIFGAYGIIMSFMLIVPVLIIVKNRAFLVFKRFAMFNISISFVLLLLIIHSFVAGHVLVSPTTQTILVSIIFLKNHWNEEVESV